MLSVLLESKNSETRMRHLPVSSISTTTSIWQFLPALLSSSGPQVNDDMYSWHPHSPLLRCPPSLAKIYLDSLKRSVSQFTSFSRTHQLVGFVRPGLGLGTPSLSSFSSGGTLCSEFVTHLMFRLSF